MADQPLRRFWCRALVSIAGGIIKSSEGWHHVASSRDPFILAANHSQKLEALLLPALLAFHRGGRQVHFLVDWNFLLYPGLASLIRMNDPVVVVRKSARPKWLNIFRPWFARQESPMKQARRLLESGRPVGIFPEGTVNSRGDALMRGLTGAARLSLETGAPVVPVGIRFPNGSNSEFSPFTIHIGEPLKPARHLPKQADENSVRAWHQRIMFEIAALSGKSWTPQSPRNKHEARNPRTTN